MRPAHNRWKGYFAMRKATIAAVAVAAASLLPVAATAAATPSTHASSASSSSQSSSSMLNAQDRMYLKESAQGALWEVQGGKIAQTHASRSYVRAFGQRMIVDHSKQYRDAREVGEDVHVSIPKSPDDVQQHDLMLLAQFHGAAFDCAYLSTEWADHTADVAMTKLEIAIGQSQRVKAYARKYLPVLQAHLKLAEDDLMKTQYCGSDSDDD
jgi:putative membrane protein